MNKPLLFTIFMLVFALNSSGQKLMFDYDSASNQNQRYYCPSGNCTPPTPPSKPGQKEKDDINAVDNQDFELFGLRVYPNPTPNRVYISLEGNSIGGTTFLKVYNANSLLIRELSIKSDLEFDLSPYASGLYLFVFVNPDGTTKTKRIIKY